MKVYLVYLGWSPKDISDWIGHTNYATTDKWYTIITKDYKKEKEKSLETLIFQAFLIIGATGFEPATSASRTQRSTKLSHAPFLTTLFIIQFLWQIVNVSSKNI